MILKLVLICGAKCPLEAFHSKLSVFLIDKLYLIFLRKEASGAKLGLCGAVCWSGLPRPSQRHPVWPKITASAPAKIQPQARNSDLDAHVPALASLEAPGVFEYLACLRELIRRQDSDQLHSSSREDLLGVGGIHTSITGHQARDLPNTC